MGPSLRKLTDAVAVLSDEATVLELAVRAALSRADVAELRLHRLGVALAWRKADAAKYAEALARLEREAAG